MRIVMFYHSLLSCWNHGNAHFLRGVVSELLRRGHDVRVLEPRDNWSLTNLLSEHGQAGLEPFRTAYPNLTSRRYTPDGLDLPRELDGADLVIVHEWNDHDLVAQIGRERERRPNLRALFHDTHHRSVSAPAEMARYDLTRYDGALVFGQVLRDLYQRRRWVRCAWTWHEAADTAVFHPKRNRPVEHDLVWIGNWGDGERAEEIDEFLLQPVQRLGLRAAVFGVRYPEHALRRLHAAGVRYCGWLPNAHAPEVFARARVTVHIPRRPYARTLPGIPTIRVFEALACGVPLVSAPWHDAEGLFHPGQNYLTADSGPEMTDAIRYLLDNPDLACAQAERGVATIRRRHACSHRVDELLGVCRQLGLDTASPSAAQDEPASPQQPIAGGVTA